MEPWLARTRKRFVDLLVPFRSFTIEGPATDAAMNQTVACFHTVSHATAKINEAESEVLADSRRITPDYAGYSRIGKLVSVLVSVWTLQPPNSLLHSQFGMVAGDGIEPPTQGFSVLCSTD